MSEGGKLTLKFLIMEFRRKDNINFLFLTTFNKKTARTSGLEDETDNLLFIFFVDAHAVEIHALVGDLAKGFVVDKHPANEIFVFVDWKALHSE